MLSDIKRYLMTHKRAALADLALHFDTDAATMQAMLDHWIRKGAAVKSDLRAACNGTCGGCRDRAAMEVCEWIDNR